MKTIAITLNEHELITLLDVLDQALDDKTNDLPSISRLFDRLSEVSYVTWDEEETREMG